MAHDLVTELLQYSSLACFMPIGQLCANLLIPNCLRSNLSYSPLAALELNVNTLTPRALPWTGDWQPFQGAPFAICSFIMCVCFATFCLAKKTRRDFPDFEHPSKGYFRGVCHLHSSTNSLSLDKYAASL